MKEWYMDTNAPQATSGYTDDVLSGYAQSNFTDVLLTTFSDEVTIYSHDLSTSQTIHVCVQDNVASTQLKSMDRTILCPIGTLNAGMYVYFENAYWLVTGRPGNNKCYEKATMTICNWLLKWQNTSGAIVQRWAIVASAAKYNDGEDGNKTLFIGSDQLSIQIPLDDEAIAIRRDIKFFIDYNTTDPTVYELTNPSNVLYRYANGSGITNWIAKEIAYTPTEDDLTYGVCEYFTPTTPPEPSTEYHMIVTCANRNIKTDGEPKTITAQLYDGNGEPITDASYGWTVTATHETGISYDSEENELIISVSQDYEWYGEEISITAYSVYTGQTDTIILTVQEVY